MKAFYVIYLSVKEDATVVFSPIFSSFNKAKENIDIFLKDYAEKRGKSISFLSKEELEKLKLNKKPDDCFYIRKKTTEATVYFRNTLHGTWYNSFSIDRYGKLGINEFNIEYAVSTTVTEYKKEEIKKETVEKMSHGAHVNFISELKDVISKRKNLTQSVLEENSKRQLERKENTFITSLIEKKKLLKNITPPPERKLIL